MSIDLIIGDCRDVLQRMPPRSIDAVITDPPYGETSLDWDQRVDGWLDRVRPLLADHASLWCFGSLRFFVTRAADFSGWNLAQEIVWEKHNGSSLSADRFRRVHELAAQFYPAGASWAEIFKKPVFTQDAVARTVRTSRKPVHWNDIGARAYKSVDGGPRLMRSVFSARSEHGRAVHPTQKPVAVLLPLIEYSCPPGGVVLDPFAGSGSTGIAARLLGRRAILIERNADYAAAARHRLDNDAPLLTAERRDRLRGAELTKLEWNEADL